MVDSWWRFFHGFGADLFTVYADFSRFIRGTNGEKKNISLLMIFFTVSFSRFAPLSRVWSPLKAEKTEKPEFRIWTPQNQKRRNCWHEGPETTENGKRNLKKGLRSRDTFGAATFGGLGALPFLTDVPNFLSNFGARKSYSQEFVFPSFWRTLGELFRVNSYKNLVFVMKRPNLFTKFLGRLRMNFAIGRLFRSFLTEFPSVQRAFLRSAAPSAK